MLVLSTLFDTMVLPTLLVPMALPTILVPMVLPTLVVPMDLANTLAPISDKFSHISNHICPRNDTTCLFLPPLDRSWRHLGLPFGLLGTTLVPLGLSLAVPWRPLETILVTWGAPGRFFLILAQFWADFGSILKGFWLDFDRIFDFASLR